MAATSSLSLRQLTIGAGAVMAVLGAAIAVALILLTNNTHDSARQIRYGFESLRIGDDLELALASLREADAPSARTANERLLADKLTEAQHYIDSPAEGTVVTRLTAEVEDFVAAVEANAAGRGNRTEVERRYQTAVDRVHDLIQINVDQSREVEAVASRSDDVANVVGVAGLALLLGALGIFVWWTRRLAIVPVSRLVDAFERYAAGQHEVRAHELGPAEFRRIAVQFNEMAAALERQRHLQLTFLAGVAHDLRNPLSALKMATALIPPDAPMPPEQRVRQLFARIDRQIDRLGRMVDDFLDAARIEAGQLELRVEPCDARELARATLDLFEPATKTHTLDLVAPEEPVPLRCDPLRLEQVLANLVSNAIKYSAPGTRVAVAVAAAGETIRWSVADQGVGMTTEDAAGLFEPFRRTGLSKDIAPGIGLGLFVARRIVLAHGGDITVESAPGKGSTFTVTIPVS